MVALTYEELETIERIVLEASAFGMQIEVVEWANKLIEEGVHPIDAYQSAFSEWIK